MRADSSILVDEQDRTPTPRTDPCDIVAVSINPRKSTVALKLDSIQRPAHEMALRKKPFVAPSTKPLWISTQVLPNLDEGAWVKRFENLKYCRNMRLDMLECIGFRLDNDHRTG